MGVPLEQTTCTQRFRTDEVFVKWRNLEEEEEKIKRGGGGGGGGEKEAPKLLVLAVHRTG